MKKRARKGKSLNAGALPRGTSWDEFLAALTECDAHDAVLVKDAAATFIKALLAEGRRADATEFCARLGELGGQRGPETPCARCGHPERYHDPDDGDCFNNMDCECTEFCTSIEAN